MPCPKDLEGQRCGLKALQVCGVQTLLSWATTFQSTRLRVQGGVLGTLEPFELDLVLRVTKGMAATTEVKGKG